jgi:hypothetical protein
LRTKARTRRCLQPVYSAIPHSLLIDRPTESLW